MELARFLQAKQLTVSTLLLQYYRQLGLSDTDFVTYLHLMTEENNGYVVPDIEALSKQMACSLEECYARLSRLEHKQVIMLQRYTTKDGKTGDMYSLLPMYDRIEQLMLLHDKEESERDDESYRLYLLRYCEQLVQRPLSSMDITQIEEWIYVDRYDQRLIQLAFMESVRRKVNNPFPYANRILQRWRQERITTEEQAMASLKKSQSYKEKELVNKENKDTDSVMTVPIFNDWS